MDKELVRNKDRRGLREYLSDNRDLIPRLVDIGGAEAGSLEVLHCGGRCRAKGGRCPPRRRKGDRRDRRGGGQGAGLVGGDHRTVPRPVRRAVQDARRQQAERRHRAGGAAPGVYAPRKAGRPGHAGGARPAQRGPQHGAKKKRSLRSAPSLRYRKGSTRGAKP